MNLIFDRTTADVEAAKAMRGKTTEPLKGCYNVSDLNRVEAAVAELAGMLSEAGYKVAIEQVPKGFSRLPVEYTELEYIQSDGTQYINTGFKPDGKSRIVMDCAPTSTEKTFCFYCARSIISGTAEDSNTLFYTSSTYQSHYYGTSKSTSGAYAANERFKIDSNKGAVNIGIFTLSNVIVATASPMPWILMASAKGTDGIDTSSLANYASMKLFSCRIYNDGNLVRDFIPAKNSNGTIGLYDLVNKAFYNNAGSGVFTAGTEIGASEYREWQVSDIIRRAQFATYIANVQSLCDAFYTRLGTAELPAAGNKLTYEGVNTIERVLFDINELIGCMKGSYRYSGTFSAGENAVLPRRGSDV